MVIVLVCSSVHPLLRTYLEKVEINTESHNKYQDHLLFATGVTVFQQYSNTIIWRTLFEISLAIPHYKDSPQRYPYATPWSLIMFYHHPHRLHAVHCAIQFSSPFHLRVTFTTNSKDPLVEGMDCAPGHNLTDIQIYINRVCTGLRVKSD